MAYGIKYRTEFLDISDNRWKIVFRKRDYTGLVYNVDAGNEPLVFTMPRADKFAPVKGSGATVQLFSDSDRQYVDLYTADHKEWKVDIYKNDKVYLLGYVEPESYTEDFGIESNYEVSIIVNNGINVLEREMYVNKWGVRYKGLATIFQVVLNAIAKLDLNIENIVYATDLRINRMFVPVSQTVLHKMTVNQDNYIDEDDIVMSCREVLESVLTPETLTLFIVGADLWLADMEYLKKGSVYVKKAAVGNYAFSQVKVNLLKDIFDLDQQSSSFQLIAGFNNYRINKNRYVKDIFEEVDFNAEENVPSEITFVGQFMAAPQMPDIWYGIYPLPFFNYIISEQWAHAGGIKPRKYVDNILLPWQEDGKPFANYLFVSPPWQSEVDFINGPSVPYPAPLPSSYGNVAEVAFYYAGASPFLFPSQASNISLSFSAHLMGRGKPKVTYIEMFNNWLLSWENLNLDQYRVLKHKIKIVFKDAAGVIKYSVVNNAATSSAALEFSIALGDHFTYYIIDNVNEVGNPDHIFNKDIPIKINIPVSFDSIYRMEFLVYNEFYRLVNNEEIGDYKGTLEYLGIRNIKTEVVDSLSGELVDLTDAEMQFYLSDQFKSDSITDELTTYTAEEAFVTDLSGITVGSDYIEIATANGISTPDLELLKGDKIVRQYKETQVELTINFAEEDIPIYTIMTMRRDAHWASKQWMIVAMSHNARQGQIGVTLEELK